MALVEGVYVCVSVCTEVKAVIAVIIDHIYAQLFIFLPYSKEPQPFLCLEKCIYLRPLSVIDAQDVKLLFLTVLLL